MTYSNDQDMNHIIIATAIVLSAIMVTPAFAQIDEVDVGFDWGWKSCTESFIATSNGTVPRLNCSWLGEGIPEAATIVFDHTTGTIKIVIEEEEEEEEIELETMIPKESSKPVIKTEMQIEVEGIVEAREIVEAYGRGELDLEEFCFGGVVKENTIFFPDTGITIDIKTPNDNVPFKTNLQFYYEHTMSEICKAEYTLDNKVHNAKRTRAGEGEQVIFIPPTDFSLYEGFENAVGNYSARDQVEYFQQKSIMNAEDTQCSKEGTARGLCVQADFEDLTPEPTISEAGQKALDAYWILRETGVADIPFQEPEVQPTQEQNTRQYLAALGWTDEQIDAMIEAGEEEQTDEVEDEQNN